MKMKWSRTMKQIIMAVLLSCLIFPAIFAAGQQEPAAAASSEETTLNIWTWYPREQIWNEISEGFSQDHPGINLDVTIVESLKYQEKLPIALATGEDLDLVGVQATSMVDRIKDYLEPMDGLMNEYVGADWKGLFVDKYIANDTKISDRLYFMSTGASGSMVCYYNAEMFDELGLDIPRTYADLKNVSDTISQKKPGVNPRFIRREGLMGSG